MEKLRIALVVMALVIGNIGFFAFMQSSPTLCDGLGYPVCTGTP